MKLIVVGSGSNGNSYALKAENGETLLIEAGIKIRDVKRTLHYDGSIVGCICSHHHGDHFSHAREYIDNGIDIYSNPDAIEILGEGTMLRTGTSHTISSFTVTPFSVDHDVMNYGYLIYHHEMGTLCFATDCYNISSIIKGVNHWLIEANYDDNIVLYNLLYGVTDRAQYKRLMLAHFSLDNCIKYLHDCNAEKSSDITLIHLSSRNSYGEAFKRIISQEFGVPCNIAMHGLKIMLYGSL